SMLAAVLSQRVYWSDSFAHPSMDRDLSQSAAQQNPHLVRSAHPALLLFAISLQTERPPFDDLRVRQALSEAIRREAIDELASLSGGGGTANNRLGFWAMPRKMRRQPTGYAPDMAKGTANAKKLQAAYKKNKAKLTGARSSSSVPPTSS